MLIVKANKSSRPEVFLGKDVLKISSKFARNHTSAWVFSYKFAAFFRTPFLKNTSGRLLLNEIKVESYLPNYATRLKNATGIDTSKFAKKADLASLKADVDELDIHKLKILSDDLIKLSNVADNNFVRKTT